MTRKQTKPRLAPLARFYPIATGVALLLFAVSFFLSRNNSIDAHGVVYETHSNYSHIKVVADGSLRYLYFVRDNGEEVVESATDLRDPKKLILPYTQIMFASLLVRPNPEDCLLVGIGGGGMVSFINDRFPTLRLDAVEIDPEIVSVARKHFALQPGPNTKIITADGFDFIAEGAKLYDIIYLDAFLKPSEHTDATGAPRRMKQSSFYTLIKRRLNTRGLLVININNNAETEKDIALIRTSFPTVYVFPDPRQGNIIVLASIDAHRASAEEIRERARSIDASGKLGFSMAPIAGYYRESN